MNSIDELIDENISSNRLLSDGCSGVVIALSGGSDSMTLLDYFIRNVKDMPFAAAHVNHCIRKESENEEIFVSEYCRKHGVICEILRVDVPNTKPSGLSLEEYARQIRYGFFDEVRKKYGFSHIATAHNKNDMTESFFLNIIRGSGIRGASGIPVSRKDNVIRPMLLCEKKDILDHCNKEGIPYVTDHTNFENICTRNRLRNEILPLLREINPRLDDAVYRFSSLASDDEKFFERIVDDALASFGQNRQKNEIPLNFLKTAEKSVISRLLRRVFDSVTTSSGLTFAQTNDIISLLETGRTSDRVLISDGWFAVLGYDSVRFVKENVRSESIETVQIFEGANNLGFCTVNLKKAVADKNNIRSCFRADQPLFIRTRKASDRIKLYRRPEKSIRELFIDDKIPADQRNLMYIVTDEFDNVVWLRKFGANGQFIPGIGEMAWEIEIIDKE